MTNEDSKLELSSEEMRRLGYQIVDLLIDHFQTLSQKSPTNTASRSDLETLLREPLPRQGQNIQEVLQEAQEKVLSHIMHLDHPRFFGFIPSPSNFISVMADTLSSGLNVFAGTWLEAAGPAQVELVTIDWLRQLCGFPEQAGGLFTSGGSAANLTAMAVARHIKLQDDIKGTVVYFSDQTHSSIERALKILGFSSKQFRRLPSNADFTLDIDTLVTTITKDRRDGLRPFCVVANPGTTNSGAVDSLQEIAAICNKEDLWLHADGAYGIAAVFCQEGKKTLV
jgi:glutamate/tyrosine decarboxylase-like PLP-dependent enzyme